MRNHEREHGAFDSLPEPLDPSPLPPELAGFLKDREFACLTHGTDQGTVLVVKAPAHEIRSLHAPVPVHLRYELYEHPAAPVIRMVTRIYDQPDRPLALETYINVEDPQQRADLSAMTSQDRLIMLFYDEGLAHRLTKTVPHLQSDLVAEILTRADDLLTRIPRERFDFDLAKRRVMDSMEL